MAVQTTRSVEELEAYCARLRAAGLDAPWSRPGPLIPPKPTATQARHWRWRDIEPLLFESSEYLSPHRGAERRVLRLHNPGVPERTVAHSLVLAVQYLLPGEVAPAHRHSPTAIRFMLHGEGAFTTVDGQKCADEARRPGGDARDGVARPRQRGRQAHLLDGHPRLADRALSREPDLRAVSRTSSSRRSAAPGATSTSRGPRPTRRS